jgi:lysophospholipase L1-like esterase
MQLVKALEEENILINKPKIIAQTVWTTTDLKKGVDLAILDFPYDWVSLLIGVNNQYQGKSIEVFKAEFQQLLSQAILFAGNKSERLFVVSIPDWGKMPFANNLDQEQISREIDDYNQVVYEVCIRNEITFIDVTTLSRTIDSNPHLIASDSLHPSGSQYAKWVAEIIPFFKNSSND